MWGGVPDEYAGFSDGSVADDDEFDGEGFAVHGLIMQYIGDVAGMDHKSLFHPQPQQGALAPLPARSVQQHAVKTQAGLFLKAFAALLERAGEGSVDLLAAFLGGTGLFLVDF